ncbi:MAG: hypothetical protein WCC84_14720 [Candidatus Cybelea sp.]
MTALLTTVIALIGVYIAFALAASWVNEQIATFLQLRSKTLIAGIRSMIGDAAAADFFGHPLIVSLGEAPAKNIWAKLGTLSGLKYITQSVSTVKASAEAAAQTAAAPATAAPDTTTPKTTQPAVKQPPYVSAEHFAVVLADLLRRKAPGASPLASLGASASDVAAALNAIGVPGNPYKPLYDILLPIWTDAKGDYDRFTDALGSWYDSQMERVSGWYKRSVQIILVYIGLIVAFSFNVDTIQIIRELQQNATLANSLAAATQAYFEANKDKLKTANSGLDLTSLSGTKPCTKPMPCTCPGGFVADDSISPSVCRIDQSGFSQLPIGWTGPRWAAFTNNFHADKRRFWPKVYGLVHTEYFWLKIFGLGITGVAILLGAPFWFDVLGAIVNVRSVGAKPPPSSSS